MNRKLRKTIKSFIASLLIVTLLFTSNGFSELIGWIFGTELTTDVLASPAADGYVSEIKVYEGSDPNALKKQIEEDGYYYVDQDMNQGAGGSYTYLAYKISPNKEDAITNMKILSQDTGFRDVDYGALIDANSDQFVQVAKELFVACKEYSRQLQVGSPAATFANSMLNMYYYPDADGRNRPLGDFLADQGAVTQSILFRIITRSSSTMVSSIFKYIALGVSSYADMEGSTWISRLSEEGMVTFDENSVAGMTESKKTKIRKNFWTDYDLAYKQNAMNLAQVLGDFAKSVTEARAYADQCGGTIDISNIADEELTLEQIAVEFQEESTELLEHEGNYISEENKQNSYAAYLIAYEAFNEYDLVCEAYGTSRVGDYLVALGNDLANNPSDEDYRNAYGLIRSMSSGQYVMTRMNGVNSLLNSLCNEDEAFEQGYEEIAKIKASLKEKGYGTMISIWIDTDEDMYQQKVAVTDEVSRGMRAGIEINRDRRNWAQRADDYLSSCKIWIDIVSDSITLVYLSAMLATTVVAGTANLGALSLAAVSVGWWAGSAGYVLAGCLGMVVYGLGLLCTAIAVILIIWVVVDTLVEALYPTEETPDYQVDKIPWVLYDSIARADKQGAYYYVKYYVALNQKREPADVNGYSQRMWDVIYYTKESWAGSPIRTDDLGEVFRVNTDLQLQVKGYEPVCMFGNSTAANLNIDTKEGKSLFLYYRTEASIKAAQSGDSVEETDSNDGQIIDKKKKYLNDIMIVFGTTEENRVNIKRMEKAGFTVIQEDLSPKLENYIGNNGKYKYSTYIGIKTTDREDQAIRDIRVAPYYAAQAYSFGGVSYAFAGTVKTENGETVVTDGTLSNGSGMYFTRDKSAGDPILADLKIVYDTPLAWDNEEGWEPISSFSGGVPADFYNGGFYEPGYNEIAVTPDQGINYTNWYWKHRYVYFRTETNYNADPNAETYLAGISFVGGEKTVKCGSYNTGSPTLIKEWTGSSYEKVAVNGAFGYVQALGVEAFDMQIAPKRDSREQYICYTLTHNPNRAIYDIATFQTQNDKYGVNISKGKTAYGACDSYEQSAVGKWGLRHVEAANDLANYAHAHSFRAISPYHCFNQFYQDSGPNGYTREIMYVTGKVSGKKPIRFEDVAVTDQKLGEGYVGVHTILKSFETEAYNLRMDRDEKNPVYMYLANRTIPTRGKYIQSISVGIGDGDEALLQALAGAGAESELLPVNLADAGNDILRTAKEAGLNTADYTDMVNVDFNNAAYIMVSYTDKAASAVTDLVKIRVTEEQAKTIREEEARKKQAASGSTGKQDGQQAAGKTNTVIKVNGKEYTKASNLISSKTGDWLLYIRKNSSDVPITEITVDDQVFTAGYKTMQIYEYSTETNAKGETVCDSFDLRLGDRLFLHAREASAAKYIGNMYLGVGGSKKEAQLDALKQGATGIVDYNLNMNVGGKYIYLGYDRTKSKMIAARDMIITEGKPYEEIYSSELKKKCIYLDGLEYELVGEASLNDGTYGKELYLYYTGDSSFGMEPYVSLYAGLGDSIPLVFTESYLEKHSQEEQKIFAAGVLEVEESDVEYLYERVLDNAGNIIDLNAGLFATKDGQDVESRIYLYGARADKSSKDAANAKTFDRAGTRVTLYGTYGASDLVGELKMK